MIKHLDTAIALQSADQKAELSFYKQGGGFLNALVLNTENQALNILPSFDKLDDIKSNAPFRCTNLFPFPNRLRDGKYSFEGKDYQFPINEKWSQNNLHGFLKDYIPLAEVIGANSNTPSLLTRYSYDGSREYYPFPADILVEYIFESSAELKVTFTVINKGTGSMPVGVGWHPYFTVGETIDELEMLFPPCEQVLIDERMIPTGVNEPYTKFNAWKKIEKTELDTCFVPAMGALEEVSVKLWSSKLNFGIEVWQDKNFGFIQVYTSPDRKSIAIEPMSCNINAFQSKDGLSVLTAGESFSGSFGVRAFTNK